MPEPPAAILDVDETLVDPNYPHQTEKKRPPSRTCTRVSSIRGWACASSSNAEWRNSS